MDANLPVTIRTVRTTVNASIDCKLSNRLFEFGTFPLLQRQSMDWRRTSKCSLLEGNLMFELLDPELQSTIFHVLIESLSVPIWNREKIWSKFEVYLLRLLNWKFRAKSGEYSVSRYGRPYSGVRLVKLLGNSIQITSLKSLHHVRTKTAA